MDKETFERFLGDAIKKQQERVRFFQIQFAELNKKTIQNFHYMFEMNTFTRGQTIYLENEDANAFYLIKNGEAGLFKFTTKHLKLRSKILKEEIEEKSQSLLKGFYEFDNEGIYSFKKAIDNTSKAIICVEKAVPITLLEPMSFFGEESLLQASNQPILAPKYYFTAVALKEPTVVFSMNRSKFNSAQKIIGSYAFENMLKSGVVGWVEAVEQPLP
jgi:CRP-like cAMP-binding protein